MDDANRYLECLLGLATGDAVGTTLEFQKPGTFAPIDDIVGGGPFGLEPGQWTDDTSMALCSAEILLACDGLDPEDQLRRSVRWWREGEQHGRVLRLRWSSDLPSSPGQSPGDEE